MWCVARAGDDEVMEVPAGPWGRPRGTLGSPLTGRGREEGRGGEE